MIVLAATALALGLSAPPALLAEARTRLVRYLQVDTTNPPGREAAGADLLERYLRQDGIVPKRYQAAPGRVSLVARLKGTGLEPPLMLLHHIDVVGAEAATWQVPPFAGAVRDGAIWGRGALDMKGLGIMQLQAFVALKRSGRPLRRDVIYCAVADEEAGSERGMAWLARTHPEAVRCADVLNEGGFGLAFSNGARVMGIGTGERGVLWVKVTATGHAGHGSVSSPEEATQKLVRALGRLQSTPARLELLPETRRMLPLLALGEDGIKRQALSLLAQPWAFGMLAPALVKREPLLGSFLGDTVHPTMLIAGSKANVVPRQAQAVLDVRLLPGHDVPGTLRWLQATMKEPGLKLEVLHALEASRSPADTGLYTHLAAAIRSRYPGVPVSPLLSTGSTDSGFLRALGARAYGCVPVLLSREQLATMHGADERMTLSQLEAGTRVVVDAVGRAALSAR